MRTKTRTEKRNILGEPTMENGVGSGHHRLLLAEYCVLLVIVFPFKEQPASIATREGTSGQRL